MAEQSPATIIANLQSECGICTHRDREVIDEHLADGRSLTLARAMWPGFNFGEFSYHREHHIRNRSVKVQTDPIRLIRTVQTLGEYAQRIVALGDNEAKPVLALTAIKVALDCVAREAELSGVKMKIDPKTLLPFWNKLQQAILGTLERFPEARDAVLAAIEDVQLEDEPTKVHRKALM